MSCYTGYQFPPTIIIWIYFRFPLSLHMVKDPGHAQHHRQPGDGAAVSPEV